MWFGVLGPLLVCDGDEVVHVPAARQRVLLAALLLRANRVVAADTLTELIWDGVPPAGAGVTLRSHVSRLRQVLGPDAGARLVTRYPGYLIEAGDDEVDLLRFTRLCREGAGAVRAEAWAKASDLLDEALGLWRGEPLADIRCEQLHRDETPGLNQLRLQALEWQIEARLHLGHHGELVAQLLSLTAAHPLQERFYAQLMLAHYQCGRQAEALATYQQARHVLADALGADPGTELRELHQWILAGDPSLDTPRPTSSVSGSTGSAVPRQLPAPVAHFAGRTEELATLTRLLDRPPGQAVGPGGDQAPEAIVISAIGGTAGVGKTALAVHWAHRVADRFPDGQLYVNLRGYDPAQPMPATDALAGFLRALGVPGHDIPAGRGPPGRTVPQPARRTADAGGAGQRQRGGAGPAAAAWQSGLHGRGDQPRCAGRACARDGAGRLDLDLLPLDDAVGLLRALIGGRVDADPDAAEALAGRCCRLPLALRVAAELAVARPAVTLADWPANWPTSSGGWTCWTPAETSAPRCGRCSRGRTGTSPPTPPARSGCLACIRVRTWTARLPPRSPAPRRGRAGCLTGWPART